MGIITFNGVASDTLGIRVSKPPAYAFPEKDVTLTLVPGRNGEIIQFNGGYRNVDRDYDVSFPVTSTFAENAGAIAQWLSSPTGYTRLEDTYEPLCYRMAIYRDSNVLKNLYGQAGTGTISFYCKPQRFLKTGESEILCQTSGSINNPTAFDALPLIKVTGSSSGTITVGGITVTISNIATEIYLDSETQNAYLGTTNRNGDITASAFPILKPGVNNVGFTGGVTSITITPRWWTL